MSDRTTILDELAKLEGFGDSQRARIGMAAARSIVEEAEKLEARIEASDLDEVEKLERLIALHSGTALAVATIVGQHVLSLAHDPSRKKA